MNFDEFKGIGIPEGPVKLVYIGGKLCWSKPVSGGGSQGGGGTHTHDYEVAFHQAGTCSSEGYTRYKCKYCSDSYTETGSIDSSNHYGPFHYEGPDYDRYQVCEACNQKVSGSSGGGGGTSHAHVYEVVSTNAGTCSSEGYTRYKCKYCSDSYTVTGSTNSSVHSGPYDEWVDGNETPHKRCASCGTQLY